jgi:hypothetical protein
MAHYIGTVADDERILARSSLLGDDTKQEVLQAKIEARDIIARLDPEHIDSWSQLIWTLEDCTDSAKRNMFIICGSLREEALDSASEHNRQIRIELNRLVKKRESIDLERRNLWPGLRQAFKPLIRLKNCVMKLIC